MSLMYFSHNTRVCFPWIFLSLPTWGKLQHLWLLQSVRWTGAQCVKTQLWRCVCSFKHVHLLHNSYQSGLTVVKYNMNKLLQRRHNENTSCSVLWDENKHKGSRPWTADSRINTFFLATKWQTWKVICLMFVIPPSNPVFARVDLIYCFVLKLCFPHHQNRLYKN